ncbi:AraC family transcriptional regulator [Paenibacillus cremeus]|nr:AraC family transcriptional regulator [Paenibacillus cremeus]
MMFFADFKIERDFVFKEKYGDSESHELHFHDVLEYHILVENEANFQLAHKKYDGTPGDVFLFRPFEPHWNLVKNAKMPIRWISLLLSPSIVRLIPNGYKLLAPFYAVEAISPLIPASSSSAIAIHQLAKMAIEEEKTKAIGWEAKQFLLVIDILVHTLRHASKRDESISSAERFDDGMEVYPSIIQAIEYILEHFTEEIDVNHLLKMAGKRHTAFYRTFRSVTGMTPNMFIHRLRMQAAIYMLVNSDKRITDIAHECGYSSIHYFNKHFKDYRGVSPREYRKSNEKN